MSDAIQSELDEAEKYILNKLFGDADNIQLGNKAKLFCLASNVNFESFVNNKIEEFEIWARGFITPNGYIDGARLSEFLMVKWPVLRGCIALPTLKPIEYAKIADTIINFEALGTMLK